AYVASEHRVDALQHLCVATAFSVFFRTLLLAECDVTDAGLVDQDRQVGVVVLVFVGRVEGDSPVRQPGDSGPINSLEGCREAQPGNSITPEELRAERAGEPEPYRLRRALLRHKRLESLQWVTSHYFQRAIGFSPEDDELHFALLKQSFLGLLGAGFGA